MCHCATSNRGFANREPFQLQNAVLFSHTHQIQASNQPPAPSAQWAHPQISSVCLQLQLVPCNPSLFSRAWRTSKSGMGSCTAWEVAPELASASSVSPAAEVTGRMWDTRTSESSPRGREVSCWALGFCTLASPKSRQQTETEHQHTMQRTQHQRHQKRRIQQHNARSRAFRGSVIRKSMRWPSARAPLRLKRNVPDPALQSSVARPGLSEANDPQTEAFSQEGSSLHAGNLRAHNRLCIRNLLWSWSEPCI